jgi:YD repeat-containing protein
MEEDEGEIYLTTMTYTFTYDSSNRLTRTVLAITDGDEEIIFSTTDNTWNASGKLIANEVSSLSFFTFTLEKSNRTEFQYNASGDLSVETTSDWNRTTSAWVISDKTEYTYGSANAADVIFPNIMNIYLFDGPESMYNFNKAPASTSYYEMKEGSWVLTERSTFYYGAGTSTGIPTLENGTLSLYPNPFSDRIGVNWSDGYNQLDVELFQVSGVRMLQQVVQPGAQIGTEYLPEGVYLFRISQQGTTIQTGKLIKQR